MNEEDWMIGQPMWCGQCQRMRTVEDDSIESQIGPVNFQEVEVHVRTLTCQHEVVSRTGVVRPRPDGLSPF